MSMVSLPGLRALIDSVSQQRNLPKQAVSDAIAEALLKGYERYRRTQSLDSDQNFGEDYFDNFAVQLNLKAEGFRVVAHKTIVEKVSQPDKEVALKAVRGKLESAGLGDTVVVDVTPQQGEFGRLAAYQTKLVLSQKLQEHQYKVISEQFEDLQGTVLQARVLRNERRAVILGISSGLGKPEVEAELPNHEKLPNDNYEKDVTFKVYLKKIFTEARSFGPLLRVSRASTHLISGLFVSEVPEIQQGIVEIKGVVRDAIPSSREVAPRCKIAVHSLQPEVDPVAVCVGEGGAILQAVMNEMRGEEIEVIRWSDDPATYIANSLTPAVVMEAIAVDPEAQKARVIVAEDQLPLAIGKDNQNLRLASRLTGWKLEIKMAGNGEG